MVYKTFRFLVFITKNVDFVWQLQFHFTEVRVYMYEYMYERTYVL